MESGHLTELRDDLKAFVQAGAARWRTEAGLVPHLRASAAVVVRQDAGRTADEAVEDALMWAFDNLESDAWTRGAYDQFGFSPDSRAPAKPQSRTDREDLAAEAHHYSGSWYRKLSTKLGYAPAAKVIQDVAERLAYPERFDPAGGLGFATRPAEIDAQPPGWGWSDKEPPPDCFVDRTPGATQPGSLHIGTPSWTVLSSAVYLAVDEDEPRRQHYLWTFEISAMADGLVVYPKAFGWTGSGWLESVRMHTSGAEWLGLRPADQRAPSARWAYHLFFLGRPLNRGEGLELQYSETWFDRDYFFSPFLRAKTPNPGQREARIAIRLPAALKPTELSEMEWGPTDSVGVEDAGQPTRMRELEHLPGKWHGIRIRQPVAGTTYGFTWRSALYEGRS
jgi:hypothetical protein